MAGSRILRAQDIPAAALRLKPVQVAPPNAGPPRTVEPPAADWGGGAKADGLRQELQELQKLKDSLSTIREEAYKKGLEEGEKRSAATIAQFEAANGNLAAAVARVETLKTEMRRSAERDVLELSLAIARRVLHRELHVDPHALEGIIAAAMKRVSHQNLVVRTNPNHATNVRESLHHVLPGNEIEVVGDPALAMGSVVFELARGNMDASIEAQLDEVRRGLTDCLAERRA